MYCIPTTKQVRVQSLQCIGQKVDDFHKLTSLYSTSKINKQKSDQNHHDINQET